jgi:hypothetical protein
LSTVATRCAATAASRGDRQGQPTGFEPLALIVVQQAWPFGEGSDVLIDLPHGGREQVYALVVNKHVGGDAECTPSLAFPTTDPNNLKASIGGTMSRFAFKIWVEHASSPVAPALRPAPTAG